MTDSAGPPRGKFILLSLPRLLIASVLLFSAAVGVHSGSLGGQFLSWDDEAYLTNNLRVQNPTWENLSWFFRYPYVNSFTPAAFVSHAIDWQIWGPDPHGHHWHSLILHGVNTVALFWFGLFLFGQPRNRARLPAENAGGVVASQDPLLIGAATAALLFAVHPLRVESVAWISDRKDLLAALFGLTSALTYFRGTCTKRLSPSWIWLAVSAVLFTLALLSKFLIVFLPLAFLIIEIFYLYPGEWQQRKRELFLWKIPFLLPALAVGALAVNAVGETPLGQRTLEIPLGDRMAFLFATPWFYLQKLLLPANLSPIYQVRVSATMWIAAIPILAITALGYVLWRKKRPGLLGTWLAYLVLLGPTFLFLSPLIQHTADRHSYVSTMPIFLLAGGGVALLWHRALGQNIGSVIRTTLAALVLIIACWFSYLTVRQTRVWENSLSLWVQVVTVSPDLPIGYLNLGNAVAAAGNADDAISLYKHATALEKGYGPAWTRMGVTYQLQGKAEEAEDCFRRSIAFNPDYFEAYVNLGEVEEGKSNSPEAEKLYRQAAWRNPGSPKPWIHLGNLFRRRAQMDSSFLSFEQALAIDPLSAPAHYGIALILEGKGEQQEARRHLEDAARLGNAEAKERLRSIR